METKPTDILINWSETDQLFYISFHNEDIHCQQTKPLLSEIREAFESDQWAERFEDMRQMKRVRVSDRIYYDMLGAVPPKKQTATSFYCGECHSGNLYYYFELCDGKRYGQLKAIN